MAHWTKSIHAASKGYAREMAKRRAMHVALGRAAKAVTAVAGAGAGAAASTSGSSVAAGVATGAAAGAAATWPFILGGVAVFAVGVLVWSALVDDD